MENEEVLHTVKVEMSILHAVKGKKAKCVGHILRRNCLLKHAIEEKMDVTRRRGRRLEQLLNDLQGTRRC